LSAAQGRREHIRPNPQCRNGGSHTSGNIQHGSSTVLRHSRGHSEQVAAFRGVDADRTEATAFEQEDVIMAMRASGAGMNVPYLKRVHPTYPLARVAARADSSSACIVRAPGNFTSAHPTRHAVWSSTAGTPRADAGHCCAPAAGHELSGAQCRQECGAEDIEARTELIASHLCNDQASLVVAQKPPKCSFLGCNGRRAGWGRWLSLAQTQTSSVVDARGVKMADPDSPSPPRLPWEVHRRLRR
jgi:hypothetical protein